MFLVLYMRSDRFDCLVDCVARQHNHMVCRCHRDRMFIVVPRYSRQVSPCGNYLATSQGWSCNCRMEHAQTRQMIGMTSGHGGCINQAAFTGQGDTFVTLDHGHSGQYDVSVRCRNRWAYVLRVFILYTFMRRSEQT